MTSPSVNDCDYAPNLPKIVIRELGWMGHVVQIIHTSKSSGLVYRVMVHTLALFIAMGLCLSMIGIPLFVYGFKEYIIQAQRARYDQLYIELHKMCTEHSKSLFLSGRTAPLESLNIKLSSRTKAKMIQDLAIKPEEGAKMSDMKVFQMAAAKYADYFKRYSLKITGTWF